MRSENDIHMEILGALSTLPISECWAWDNRAVGTFFTVGGSCVQFGIRGQADILALVRGVLVGIEVKRSRDLEPDPHQWAWGAMLEDAGGVYICVWSAAGALAAVREIGEIDAKKGFIKKIKNICKKLLTAGTVKFILSP
jgi:hypothetical protein